MDKPIPHPVHKFEIKIESLDIQEGNIASYDIDVLLDNKRFISETALNHEEMASIVGSLARKIAGKIEDYWDDIASRDDPANMGDEPIDDPAFADPVIDEYDR